MCPTEPQKITVAFLEGWDTISSWKFHSKMKKLSLGIFTTPLIFHVACLFSFYYSSKETIKSYYYFQSGRWFSECVLETNHQLLHRRWGRGQGEERYTARIQTYQNTLLVFLVNAHLWMISFSLWLITISIRILHGFLAYSF